MCTSTSRAKPGINRSSSFKHWVQIFSKSFVKLCAHSLLLCMPLLHGSPFSLTHSTSYSALPTVFLCPSIPPISQSEIEGHPDVQVTLNTPKGCPLLDHLIVHPCVRSADALVLQSHSPASTDTFRKIRFSGPLEPFDLCHYTIPAPPPLPIDSYYQMKVLVERNEVIGLYPIPLPSCSTHTLPCPFLLCSPLSLPSCSAHPSLSLPAPLTPLSPFVLS